MKTLRGNGSTIEAMTCLQIITQVKKECSKLKIKKNVHKGTGSP